MSNININRYLSEHTGAQEIYTRSVNNVLSGDKVIFNVYYEDVLFVDKKSDFVLFVNGCLIGLPLDFPCSIDIDDTSIIANDMINDFLVYCENDKSMLDDISKNYKNGEKNKLEEFNFPNTYERWKSKYGVGSLKHKEYMQGVTLRLLEKNILLNGSNEKYMHDLMRYIRKHSSINTKSII